MFKQHIKLFFRNIKRSKTVFSINIIGLAGGLTSALLLFLWATNEYQMNRFDEKDSERHVQVMVNYIAPHTIETEDITPGPLTAAMATEIPEIEYAVPVVAPRSFYNGVLLAGDNTIKVSPQFVGEGYFNIFGCDFLAGDKQTALDEKQSIVISRTVAQGLFGSNKNAIGKSVAFKNEYFDGLYTISGVFEHPKNASYTYDVLFNFERFLEGRPNLKKWNNGGVQAHFVLEPGASLQQFNSKIEHYLSTKIEGLNTSLFAQKYADRYLYNVYENGKPNAGRMKYVRLFLIIGFLILALACINFSNLATANASRRIKEIGIKKTAGVQKRTLLIQFMTEAILMSLLALLLAVPIVKLLLPVYNQIIGLQLQLNFSYEVIFGSLAITLLTGLISGIYPALFLSKQEPAQSLKGKINIGAGQQWFRKGLVVFQFSISIFLLIAVLTISKQITFMQDKELGYSQEQVVSIPIEGNLDESYQAFLNEAQKLSGVTRASHMWGDLPGRLGSSNGYQWANQGKEERKIRFFDIVGGANLIDLLGLEIIKGRAFMENSKADENGIIFNETAIKTMGYENDPIGSQVYFEGNKTIVGVVKDFHFESMYEPIKPLFLELDKGDNIVLKLNAKDHEKTLGQIETLYHRFNSEFPFEYRFIDENFQELYRSEQIIALLSKYFAALAIVISCLGLFGLALFTAFQKRKEISIRKVLGQTSQQVVFMLTKDFAVLVIIAIAIAVPLGYVLTVDWLSNFAYHMPLQASHFIWAGLIALAIAMLTVGSQAFLAANRSPIKSLQTE
ncbi:MAG: FtsX-like permease family protein [Bacteroidota bacterium]